MTAQSLPVGTYNLPFLSQPVKGLLHIKAARGLKLYSIDAQGKKHRAPAPRHKGSYVIELDKIPFNHWLVLQK